MDLAQGLERKVRWPVRPAARTLAKGAALLALLSCADRMIVRRPFLGRAFWAAFDVLVHGAVALVITGPCIRRATSKRQALLLAGLAFVPATVLDLDHFISAGTLDVNAALSLTERPPTHSLTFALLVGVLASLLSRDRAAGWVAFAGIASHVLRDAAMGTAPLLWPLGVDAVPWWVYGGGEIGLMLGSSALELKVPGTCEAPGGVLTASDGAGAPVGESAHVPGTYDCTGA